MSEAGSCSNAAMRADSCPGCATIVGTIDADDTSRGAGKRKNATLAYSPNCILKQENKIVQFIA